GAAAGPAGDQGGDPVLSRGGRAGDRLHLDLRRPTLMTARPPAVTPSRGPQQCLPEGETEGSAVLSEGLREGVILGVVTVALGVAGLSPSFTWIPEVPLLAAFALVPAVLVGVAGYPAAERA